MWSPQIRRFFTLVTCDQFCDQQKVQSRAMPDYRLYPMKNARITGVPDIITADSDTEAVEKATMLMNGNSVETELWESTRRIAKLPPTKPA
jgi:hypothetical protein